MTDALDTEIRRLMGELWQQAPLPPTAEELGRRRPSHRRGPRGRAWIAAPVAMVLVLAVVILPRIDRDSSTQVATHGASTTSATGSPGSGGDTASTGNEPLPDPTFVTLSTPPAGLRFIEAGSARIISGGANEILLAGPDGRSARLLWTGPNGCAAAPVTTVRPGTEGPTTPSQPSTTPASRPEDAPFIATGTRGALGWCDQERVNINLMTVGFEESGARALAATVRPVPGRSEQLTVSPPPGFVSGRPRSSGLTYTLAFRPEESRTSRPQLIVSIRGAWTTDLRLLQVSSVLFSATEVDVGGHRGLIGERPGGPRFQSLTVVYDDRTIITLAGDGLSRDQLLSAGETLVRADPSLAPDLRTDPGKCDRLGMCG